MNECAICDRIYENDDKKVQTCSKACDDGLELMESGLDLAWKTMPDEDPRIFFYRLSFGRIIDEWSLLCLKRANTRSIRNQQEVDYSIFQIRRCIETNLKQIIREEKQRKSLMALMQDLFELNGLIWRYRDLAEDRNLPILDQKNCLFRTIPLLHDRDKIIRSIDTLVSSKTTHFRVINGQDI